MLCRYLIVEEDLDLNEAKEFFVVD